MTECITTCDRCLKRCVQPASMLALKRPGDQDFSDRDLCPECSAGLQAWLLTGPLPPAEGDTSPNPSAELLDVSRTI